MFSIIVSDFEPVRNYIKNTLKQHIGANSSMVISSIKEVSNSKINSLLEEFGQLSIFFDLDEKPRLISLKSKAKQKNVFDLMNSIDRNSNINFFVVGSESSFLDNMNQIINHNIQSHHMLEKPFNGQQLNQFINMNVTKNIFNSNSENKTNLAA